MIFLPALVSQMLGCQVGTATSGLEMTFLKKKNRRDKFKMGLSKWIPMQSDKGSNKKEGLGIFYYCCNTSNGAEARTPQQAFCHAFYSEMGPH